MFRGGTLAMAVAGPFEVTSTASENAARRERRDFQWKVVCFPSWVTLI